MHSLTSTQGAVIQALFDGHKVIATKGSQSVGLYCIEPPKSHIGKLISTRDIDTLINLELITVEYNPYLDEYHCKIMLKPSQLD